MADGKLKLELEVRLAWWLPLYAHGLALTAALTGAQPDWDKVERVIARAVKVRVAPSKSTKGLRP